MLLFCLQFKSWHSYKRCPAKKRMYEILDLVARGSLNPFCYGGRWSLYNMGGGSNWPALFNSSPGAYWAIILSILIIILFKERINDYLEKKLGQYLENWPRHCNFCRPRNFLKNFENFIFKLEIIVTRPFLKISSSSFFLTSPFLECKKILH